MYRYIFIPIIILIAALRASATPYEALIDSADNYTRMERWNDAERIYREALRQYPASPLNPMIFSNIGVCQTNLGQYDDAIDSFDIALVKSPDSVRILTAKATACLLADKDSVAFATLNHAIECDSIATIPRRLRGKLELLKGNTDAALQDFSVVMQYAPDDEWGPGGIGEVYMARENFEEAVPMLIKALSIQDEPDFRASLASAYLFLNRLADADDTIRVAIDKYPHNGEFYLLRGILHRKFHLNSEAEYDILLAKKYGIDPQTIAKYLPQLVK